MLKASPGPRLCPARRGISRSASARHAVMNIPNAVSPANPLRLVFDTAAVRPGPSPGPRLCPARRGISRSASARHAVMNIPNAVSLANPLRLVSDTAAVRHIR